MHIGALTILNEVAPICDEAHLKSARNVVGPAALRQKVAMAYEIHIERRNADAQCLPIALSEWRAVVERTDGVRMAEGDFQKTNPKTGEVIGIRNAGGDAEAFFADNEAWFRVFRWSPSGRISFRAPRDFEVPTSAIRLVALVLARGLDALLVGDEGEIYD